MITKLKRYSMSYLFILPTFIFISIFLYYPVFLAFFHSFTEWNLVSTKWIGLGNFTKMFGNEMFLKSIANQLIYTSTDLMKALIAPLIAAELIYLLKSSKAKYLFRTGFVLPMLLPSIVVILLWQNMYNPTNGLINQTLRLLGFERYAFPWLGTKSTAIWSIIFMNFPFISGLPFLIYYAAIGNISQDQIEAARIDSATEFQIITNIHIPTLIPQFKVIILLTVVNSLQDFVKIMVMTSGGPGDSTINPALVMYNAAFGASQYGFGSAIGVFLCLVIISISLLNNKFLKELD